MAHYQIAFSCGHTSTIQLTGPVEQRESRIAWLGRAGDCESCKHARIGEQRANAVSAAQAFALEVALPSLEGTSKQVTWAEQLRGKVMPDALSQRAAIMAMAPHHVERSASAKDAIQVALAALDHLSRQVKASWWIDKARANPSKTIAYQFITHDDSNVRAHAKALISGSLNPRGA